MNTQRQNELTFAGKRALVMGLGTRAGGVGVARYLARHGARVIVTDLREESDLRASIDALSDLDIEYSLGAHKESDFTSADIVVKNPGVPADSPWLEIARASGARIEMEMTLFFRACQGTIIGITGTKGKTTTATLVASIMRLDHPETVLAGNMGRSALDALPQIGPKTFVVLELSSWQLEGLAEQTISPDIAVLTNISEDHLNRYATFDDYVDAKYAITRYQASGNWFIYNADDPLCRAATAVTNARQVPFAREGIASDGAFIADDRIVWRELDKVLPVQSVSALPMAGKPGIYSSLAATAVARVCGIDIESITRGLVSASPVPDRQEFVAQIDGVTYINDTTATAPAAAIAALETFADREIILIAGGAAKGANLNEFAQVAADRANAIVLLDGDGTRELGELLVDAGVRSLSGPYHSMDDVVMKAKELARPGSCVLLSPGLASFGLFRDEFHRGSAFRDAVQRINTNAHEVH